MAAERVAEVRRQTTETDVVVRVALDGRGDHAIATGVGFLDHMLRALAAHGRLDLAVSASGDLEVDAHHTVEDVALALGRALTDALGDRRGIERFGHAVVPMDESLVSAALDCSGRGHAVVTLGFQGETVGGLPVTLLRHFLETLACTAGLTLHLSGTGGDNHHLAEAAFKALARALRQAVRRDPTLADAVPSTKGQL
ncbi:MAG TPA: imidazoleglycerol-phosphate dehydratase HisB [Candidatus Dormibacteraeota bacterium]|nr:imidazoleglycerol-phosphate dehydratase HisB [Candidatus Dormibacteraeota bacterium]